MKEKTGGYCTHIWGEPVEGGQGAIAGCMNGIRDCWKLCVQVQMEIFQHPSDRQGFREMADELPWEGCKQKKKDFPEIKKQINKKLSLIAE